jgi:hypothetical protein
MATKNLFADMLNQKAITTPQVKAKGIKVQKPPGSPEFAYLGQGNSVYRHPMENRGNQLSQSVWAKALSTTLKPKGVKSWKP